MNFIEFAKTLSIVDRKGLPIPWTWNVAQQMLYEMVVKPGDNDASYKKRTWLPKFVILKARQLGSSTFIQAYLYYLARHYGYSTVTIAHTDEDSKLLYHRFARKWWSDEIGEVPDKKDRKSGDKRWDTQNALDLESGGRIIVRSAAARAAGHSQTYQLAHLSEASRYPAAGDTMVGVIGAATHAGIIIESTANGMVPPGEWFYSFWQQSKAGKTGFTPIFLPWWIETSYVIDHYHSRLGPKDEADLKEEERNLLDEYGPTLTMDHLAWRRSQIAGPLCKNDAQRFREQFPSSAEEAFIASGTPLFRPDIIIELQKTCSEGIVDGAYTTFEEPKPGLEYIIGVDVSEGVGKDNSCIQVISRTDPPRHALEWCDARTDPVRLAHIISDVAKRYNGSYVVIEVNNHGLTTSTQCQQLGVLQYTRRQYDSIGRNYFDRTGWKTTSLSKPIMIDQLRDRIYHRRSGIRSRQLCTELLAYNPEMDGKVAGSHYDRLIAYGLALVGLDQRGPMAGQTPDVKLIPGNVATGGQDPVKMFKEQLRREKEGDKDLW